MEYNDPSTRLSQYHSAEIDDMGRSLHERLAMLRASPLAARTATCCSPRVGCAPEGESLPAVHNRAHRFKKLSTSVTNWS